MYLGDSKMRGYITSNQATKCWPAQVVPLLNAARPGRFVYQDGWNFAVSGWPLGPASSGSSVLGDEMRDLAAAIAALDPAVYELVIVTAEGGHNDLMQGASVADCVGYFQEIATKVLALPMAAGITIRLNLQTLDPNGKQYGNTSLADYETRRTAINNAALTNNAFRSWGYYNLTNCGADSRKNNPFDVTYYNATDPNLNGGAGGPDHQHETDAGQLANAQDNLPNLLATAAGQQLTPPATVNSTSNNTSGSGTSYTNNSLTEQVMVLSNTAQGVSVDAATGTVTLTTNTPNPDNGFGGGIMSKFGIGPSQNLVRGWVSFTLYASDLEYVAGLFAEAGTPASVASYVGIAFAYHLQQSASNARGVRPFGTGTGSKDTDNNNFQAFTDGWQARIVVEQSRLVWYLNAKQIFATNANDATAYYFQATLKGLGAKIRNLRIAADNLVDSGRPVFAGGTTGAGGSTATPTRSRWFKADSGLNVSGASVSWADAMGSGDVVSTSSASGTTSLLSGAANGLPALRLASSKLVGSLNLGLSGTQPFQFLMVVRLPSIGDNNNLNLMGIGLTQPTPGETKYRGRLADIINFNGKICLHFNGAPDPDGDTSGGAGENSSSAPSIVYDQFQLVGVRYDGSKGYSMTQSAESIPLAMYSSPIRPDSPLTIGGGHFDQDGDFGTGVLDVAEVITHNYYDNDAWNSELTYLRGRFNL